MTLTIFELMSRTCLLGPCDVVRVFLVWRQSIRRVVSRVCKAVQRRILKAIVVSGRVTGGRCNCVDIGIGSRIREYQRPRRHSCRLFRLPMSLLGSPHFQYLTRSVRRSTQRRRDSARLRKESHTTTRKEKQRYSDIGVSRGVSRFIEGRTGATPVLENSENHLLMGPARVYFSPSLRESHIGVMIGQW